MHFSLFTRRVIYGSLLVLMFVVGWFLHGVIQEPVQPTAKPSPQTSDLLQPIKEPLSSQMIMPPGTSFEGDFALNAIKLDRMKLTAGLHPGRGQAIPNATDVPLLPVKDINFYNW